jgi:hypothetical protein
MPSSWRPKRGRSIRTADARRRVLDVVDWAREVVARGAGEILLTSMDRDGARTGFDLALTRAVVDAVDVPVIASGGVGSLQDLVDGIVEGGADAVLAASIFHYGEFTIGKRKRRWPPPASKYALDEWRATPNTRMAPTPRQPADTMDWLDQVQWPADGLVAAIAQDAASGKVLTLAWMNREALAAPSRPARRTTGRARAAVSGTKAKAPDTCSACAKSASTATTTRSCSTLNRQAGSPVIRDANAAFSGAWKEIDGWTSSR